MALGTGMLAGNARAQAPDLRNIQPFMMLVVDTSGSMERQPQCLCTTPSCSECLPKCSLPNVSGVPPVEKKNRWAVTLEALTGTIENFECEQLDRTAANGMSYDLGYYLPYHQPWQCTSGNACPATVPSSLAKLSQLDDGIIDSYRARVRFGLMTFDGWDTYLGKGPLVPWDQYEYTLGEDEGGLWSYGSYTNSGAVILRKDGSIPGRFHYPNCSTDYQMDTGARGPQAGEGKLVSLNSCTTPPCDTVALNNDIQEALIDTRPYGGTPIAAALDDLYYHINTDLSDAYGSCRGRYAMLITDGYPDDDYRAFGCDCTQNSDPMAPGYCGGGTNNPADMMCPYPLPEDVAYDLITGRGDPSAMGGSSQDNPPLEKLIVVGLSISDNTVKDRLNLIAERGGSDPDPMNGNYALFADDLSALKVTLDSVVGGTLAPISRAVPAFANGSTGASAGQFQMTAGFQLADDVGDPWTGILERTRYTCNAPDGETIDASDRFHDLLNSQNRNLISVMPANRDPAADDGPNGHIRGRFSGAECGLSGCGMRPLSDSGTFDFNALAVADDTARQDVVNWMYGEGPLSTGANPRVGKKLGDIFHSSPQIVTGPLLDRADPAFNAFRQRPLFPAAGSGPRIADRPPVVYVSSNDGILSAFLVDDFTGGSVTRAGGDELWGFVPPLLLDQVKNNLNQHQYTMDGTPVIKDVFFQRKADGQASTGSEYHTVLITGMREGGNAYIALDVTNPFDPKFLWQFRDVPAEDMGLTYGRPAIGQARFVFDGVAQERAVAILPGGQGELDTGGLSLNCLPLGPGFGGKAMRDSTNQRFKTRNDPDVAGVTHDHRDNVKCWKRAGRSLYFVDVETGKLIKKIGPEVFPSPLVGSPAIYSDEVGTRASRAFVMDADGVMWRIDLTNPGAASGTEFDPKPNFPRQGWTARPFHDFFHDQPGHDRGEVSHEAPIISTDDRGRLVVIAATGDTDNFEKPSVENRVVSLTEVEVVSPPGSVEHYRAAFNWEHRVNGYTHGLEPSEVVTGRMVLASGQLFYASFISVSGANACDSGVGRIWSVDYVEHDTAHPNDTTPALYGPKFIPVYDSSGNPNPIFNPEKSLAVPELFIQGLAVNERPTCTSVAVNTDVSTSNFGTYGSVSSATPPARYLTAQAAGGIAASMNSGTLTGVEVQVQRPEPRVKVTAWATPID